MTDKPITAKELEELFGKVDLEQLIRDEILKEGAEEIQRQYDRHLLTTLYGSSFADGVSYEENGDKYIVIPSENYEYLMKKPPKKIKRRMSYDVYYWTKTDRVSKYFESAKKAKNYVNRIYNSNLIEYGEVVEMVKTWCYREHTPKHKCYYVSFRPNQFIVMERY